MSQNVLKRAIELCLAVYRITDKFPHDEILRAKMRQLSIDVIECVLYNKAKPANSSRFLNFSPFGGSHVGGEDFEGKLEVLFAYFSVAEKQGWVNAVNFRVLEAAYRDLSSNNVTGPDLPAEVSQSETDAGPPTLEQQPLLSDRQEKILEFLRGREDGGVITDIAAQIKTSNKTVERELKKMIAAGLVSKKGNTKGARFIIDK